MTARFVKVDLESVLWALDNVRYESTPPYHVMAAEVAACMMAGTLHRRTQRAWADRWKCSRHTVRRVADLVADLYFPRHEKTNERPANDQWATTLFKAFRHLTATKRPANDQSTTTERPTRARSSYKKERREEEENSTPQPEEVVNLSLEGQKNTSAPIKVGGSNGVQAIWAEETQARGWFAGRLSRKAVEELGKVWRQVGAESFREMVGTYMDAVQSGEHWQKEPSPQWGPFAKDARDGLNSGSVGESEEVEAVVAELQRCESWYWHGRNWGEVSAKLGPIADAVGRAMVEATGAEEPWSAYGKVKGMDDWSRDRFKKKAAAAARRMG